MTSLRLPKLLLFSFTFLLFSANAFCETKWNEFAIVIDETIINEFLQKKLDTIFFQKSVFGSTEINNAVVHSRIFSDKTFDYYLFVLFFLFLGIIRFADPKYFFEILHSFFNARLSNRQTKDIILQKNFTNFLMNLFFVLTIATFCYYYFTLNSGLYIKVPTFNLFFSSLLGVAFLYFGKYIIIKFSGWAFNISALTEQYLFNVFLLNKILGLVLLPLVFLIVFLPITISKFVASLCICFIVTSFILRYLRSWKVFSSFFNFSKFHFFTYICASELMPIAVLVKLLTQGIN